MCGARAFSLCSFLLQAYAQAATRPRSPSLDSTISVTGDFQEHSAAPFHSRFYASTNRGDYVLTVRWPLGLQFLTLALKSRIMSYDLKSNLEK